MSPVVLTNAQEKHLREWAAKAQNEMIQKQEEIDELGAKREWGKAKYRQEGLRSRFNSLLGNDSPSCRQPKFAIIPFSVDMLPTPEVRQQIFETSAHHIERERGNFKALTEASLLHFDFDVENIAAWLSEFGADFSFLDPSGKKTHSDVMQEILDLRSVKMETNEYDYPSNEKFEAEINKIFGIAPVDRPAKKVRPSQSNAAPTPGRK